MISYPDFELAIARWKARAAGVPMPSAEGGAGARGDGGSGAVAVEVPVSSAPEEQNYASSSEHDGFVSSERQNQASGSIVVSDSLSQPSLYGSK
jgi:hypothetical protein